MIYFIQAEDGGPIKIGTTEYLPKRILLIRCLIGRQVRILGVMGGARYHEGCLHIMFAHLKTFGEWFKDDPLLRDYIANNAEEWADQTDNDLPPDDSVVAPHPILGGPHEGQILGRRLKKLGFSCFKEDRRSGQSLYKPLCRFVKEKTGYTLTPHRISLMFRSHHVDRDLLEILGNSFDLPAERLVKPLK